MNYKLSIFMRSPLLALVLIFFAKSVVALDFPFPFSAPMVGSSRIFSNDYLGDGKDRWRSGSYGVSLTFGDYSDQTLPQSPGGLMEYRLRSEILAPVDLTAAAAPPDRKYVGVIGLGAFTHFDWQGTETSFGGELIFTGPATGVSRFQTWAHRMLDAPLTSAGIANSQLQNHVYPTVHGEISRRIYHRTGESAVLIRPFAEAQLGVENYFRTGVDIVFGQIQSNFFVRDPVTGFLVSNIKNAANGGVSFVGGVDVALVHSSAYLPESEGYVIETIRPRARAGIVYETQQVDVFYGLTWLGREFSAQPTGQIEGSVHLKIRF